MVVLWTMVILSLLAIGLGHRTSVELSLTKYSLGKMKANYAGWAGLMYAAEQLRRDSLDSETSLYDTLYLCGLTLEEGSTPEDVFKDVKVGEGHFDILRPVQNNMPNENVYGFEDEEAKINLNAINISNYGILSQLITVLGFDDNVSQTIASSVMDWHDVDQVVNNEPFGAEDSDYLSFPKPYHCKNAAFENLEELLLIKGAAPEIFNSIRDYLTVFPMEPGDVLVNVNTASEPVLQALARSASGPFTGTEIQDADNMAVKILLYRRGEDGEDFTADDRRISLIANPTEFDLNIQEANIFNNLRGRLRESSNIFRIYTRGVDDVSLAQSSFEAVINREDLSVLFWERK